MKSTWNCAHCEKKDHLNRSNILEIIVSEKSGSFKAKKLLFAGRKHSSNLNEIVFIIIFDYSYTNWLWKHLSESDPKCKSCLLTPWRLITWILLIVERNSRIKFKPNYLKNQKQFLEVLLNFCNSTWNFAHFQKKDQLDCSNILQIIDSQKCASFNAKKLLFQNTLQEWKCSRVPSTAQTCAASF